MKASSSSFDVFCLIFLSFFLSGFFAIFSSALSLFFEPLKVRQSLAWSFVVKPSGRPPLSSLSSPSSFIRKSRIPLFSEKLNGRMRMLDYANKRVLAPMVRIGVLPFRLECLRYGADLVYSEELIDKKLLNCVRIYNPDYNLIEYVHTKDKRVVFSTNPEEQGRVVLQMGTADAKLALQAAQKYSQDIAAVDINMGCPKSFSTSGGMGAALLSTPEIASDILKTLSSNLTIPVTCKIRVIENVQKTIDFARMCERSGASALTIHLRTKDERPSHKAHWEMFKDINLALSIPVIACGDLISKSDILAFEDLFGSQSMMYARGAMYNPTVFALRKHQKKEEDDKENSGISECSFSTDHLQMCRSFIKQAIRCRTPSQPMKYILFEMLSYYPDKLLKESLMSSYTTSSIIDLFDLRGWFEDFMMNYPSNSLSIDYYKNFNLPQEDCETPPGVLFSAHTSSKGMPVLPPTDIYRFHHPILC